MQYPAGRKMRRTLLECEMGEFVGKEIEWQFNNEGGDVIFSLHVTRYSVTYTFTLSLHNIAFAQR